MGERYKGKIVCGDIVIEIKGKFIITQKDGKAILNPVQIPEKEEPYFFKISSKKGKKVKRCLEEQVGTIDREREFLKIVKDGLKEVKYDYWISTIEPTMKDGRYNSLKVRKLR